MATPKDTSNDTEEVKPAFTSITDYIKNTFALADVNYTKSISDIKEGTAFKGFNIWILICSILIASLGLNMNSTAVVIGAMLISPLMGPILGLGLGIGTYDRHLILRALKNIAIATSISIFTAFIFFTITPTQEVPELLTRTKPTLLDLFVAFFGGVAGILAASRCQETNVVPGVAIATALMPPLCTAGFGLAIGNWDYFAGALYLFLMNSIMISFAALLVVLYLRYPKFSFVNVQRKRKVKSAIIIAVILASAPSIYFYYNLLETNLLDDRVAQFVETEIKNNPVIHVNSYVLRNKGDTTLLQVNLSGAYLEPESVALLQKALAKYKLSCTLQIIQSEPLGFKEQRLADLKNDIITELYQNNKTSLMDKDDEISMLKGEIQRITQSKSMYSKLAKLAQSQYDIDKMAIDILVYTNGEKQDTIPTAVIQWKKGISNRVKINQKAKLSDLIKIQLDYDKFRIVEIN
jgi:uncharacterized hydrophobic protein (TIGR00271 family)